MRAKQDTFLSTLPVVNYKKDQVLLFQGETPQSAYIIKKGIIKYYDISNQGFEQVISFHTTHDIFPFPWIMNTVPVSLCYYQTATDCELYRTSRDEYLEFLHANEDVLFSELRKHVLREASQIYRLTAVLQSKASDKLVNTFSYLVKNYGIFLGHNLVKINLALTHQDIASLTGLRRETIAIELSKLRDKGVIHYRPHSLYHVDVGMLNKLLGEGQIITASDQNAARRF